MQKIIFEPVLFCKNGNIQTQKFNQTFRKTPVVISSITNFNESDVVTGRLRTIGTRGFEYGMQEQQSNNNIHKTESINYIAWEPSSGNLNGYFMRSTKPQMSSLIIFIQFGSTKLSQTFPGCLQICKPQTVWTLPEFAGKTKLAARLRFESTKNNLKPKKPIIRPKLSDL